MAEPAKAKKSLKMTLRQFFKNHYFISLSVILVVASFLVYFIHLLLFHDFHHIVIYLVGDIAFVPIEVLLVSLVIHKFVERGESNRRKEKLKMVVGAFFHQFGSELVKQMTPFLKNPSKIRDQLRFTKTWTACDVNNAKNKLVYPALDEISLTTKGADLGKLLDLLKEARPTIMSMLSNEALLDNERFTELLWAIVHVEHELTARPRAKIDDVSLLGDWDLGHLAEDMARAYFKLLKEWLKYLENLQTAYPFLFVMSIIQSGFLYEPSKEEASESSEKLGADVIDLKIDG